MKRTVKICIPFILIFIIIFGNKLVFSHNKVEDKEKPSFNLLVINSYHQGHYWESFVLDGLENSLNKNEDYNINIKIEYLDFRNRHDEVYQKSFKSFLENKYRKEDIDIICAINDESYNFIKDDILDKNSMFYQIPFVFCGVNQELIYEEQDSNNIIGLDDPADTFKLVSLMKNLLPGIDNLNLIVEDSEYGNATVAEIEDVINVYSKKPMEIT